MNCSNCAKNFLFVDLDGTVRAGCCPTEIDCDKAVNGFIRIFRADPVPGGAAFTEVTDDPSGGVGVPHCHCDETGSHKIH